MKIAALAGGVGGARLAQGLAKNLSPQELSIIVNTGDDFKHFGLYISPDVDTVSYTLAGIANPETGWGIETDTLSTFNAISRLGGPDWFKLGDKDLATHLERTRLLKNGMNLTQVTRQICRALGVMHPVLPMSNDRVATWVETVDLGWLPFQEYFVKHRFQPKCRSFEFRGIEQAASSQETLDLLHQCDAVVICPSNPFVSIDPILSLPGVREIIRRKFTLCVSPIIAGKAVKGPLAKMFTELGQEPSALSVAAHYGNLLDMIVIDPVDAQIKDQLSRSSIMIHTTSILIPDLPNRLRLAKEVIELIKRN